MSDSTKVCITKLNDENYQVWSYKLELLLIKEDLWTVISDGEAPVGDEGQLKKWKRSDDKARAHIGLLIEDN